MQLYVIRGPILAAPSALLPSILQPLPPILSHVTSEAPWAREKGKDKKTCQRCGTIVPCSAYPPAPEKLLMAENWQARLCHLGRHTILYPCSASISRRNKNKEEKDNKDEEENSRGIFYVPVTTLSALPVLFHALLTAIHHYTHFTNWSHLHKATWYILT